MKKYNLRLIFVAYLLISIANVYAQKQDSINNAIENRLKIIEGAKENLSVGLDNKINAYENRFNAYTNSIDRQLNTIYIIFSVIIILGGVGSFWGSWVYFKDFVKKKIEERVANVVDENREKISKIIRDVDFENRIKSDKIILVISPNEETNNNITSLFFHKFKDFLRLETIILLNEDNIQEQNLIIKDSDLIIINDINEGQKFSSNITNKLVELCQTYKPCFLYYGVQNRDLFGKKNMNFANSEFTLYARIIETLKIQEVLRK